MADQDRDLMSSRGRPMPRVRRLESKEEILSLLEIDRLYAAYAIGGLEAGLFEQFDWHAAEHEDDIAVCQTHKGSQPSRLFTMGSESGVAVVLGSALRLPYVAFTCEPRHLVVAQAHYRTGEPETMVRMVITRTRFKPVDGDVVTLTVSDLDSLRALYRIGGLDIVTAEHVRSGIYRGVRRSGALVSVAGTHIVSPTYGLAAVGNVFTHPDYRNQGMATACTSAVTAELLRNCRDVVLNVAASNGPGIRAYAKLGYREHCRFVQVVGVRKGTAHLSAFADRLRNR